MQEKEKKKLGKFDREGLEGDSGNLIEQPKGLRKTCGSCQSFSTESYLQVQILWLYPVLSKSKRTGRLFA